MVTQLSCWFLKYRCKLCGCTARLCFCRHTWRDRFRNGRHSQPVPCEPLRSWLQYLYILGAGDRLYVFPIATHDPGYTSSAERSSPRVAGSCHQSRCIEFYLLAASRVSHLTTFAHCCHNVTFCKLIWSLCDRICTGSREYQPGANPDQFRRKWKCHRRLWPG